MRHRSRGTALTALTVLVLTGCSSSVPDDDATGDDGGDSQERFDLVAERLHHFQQEFAGDGVLVPPVLTRGSAAVPDFDFDVEDGYVLTIYCIGDATLEVVINDEPAGSGPARCDDGQISMAQNAPDITPEASTIYVDADDEDSYWLAAVTRATDAHRGGSEGSGT